MKENQVVIAAVCATLLGIGWLETAASAEPAADAVAGPGYERVSREVVDIVRENFFDAKRAAVWADAHAGYGARTRDATTFAEKTRRYLAELETSHTDYYIPTQPEYYGLLSIFEEGLKIPHVTCDSIGADFVHLPGGWFARVVFAGGPSAQGGLLRGDRILKADGQPFDPYLAIKGRAGQEVRLTVERQGGQTPIHVQVTPRVVSPKEEWLEAQRQGAKILDRGTHRIAYVPMFSCAGQEFQDALQMDIAERFQEAQALILDFRNGWGGCNPEFVNLFNRAVPQLAMIGRDGQARVADGQWRKPLFVLTNPGSRSGKELVAFAVKKYRLGTLVGERTAGAVVAGRPFLLSDRSLLLIAVADGRVDGVRLEGVGVEPDVLAPDALPYAAGKDPQLEKALELAAGE